MSDFINNKSFDGKGEFKIVDKRTFVIYETTNFRSEYFRFEYSSGHLSVYWNINSNFINTKKTFEFRNLRNVLDNGQLEMAKYIVAWTEDKIQKKV